LEVLEGQFIHYGLECLLQQPAGNGGTMRVLLSSVLAAAFLLSTSIASAMAPVSGVQAKGHISQRLQLSRNVRDKTKPFSVRLAGKSGDVIRPFTATNVRNIRINGPGEVIRGNRVTGILNMMTGAVTVKRVVAIDSDWAHRTYFGYSR
jgi:hypothetical protein